MYIAGFLNEVLKDNYAFLNISCFNIRLSSSIALVYSIELHINA